jgi:hypothetical protein
VPQDEYLRAGWRCDVNLRAALDQFRPGELTQRAIAGGNRDATARGTIDP